MIRVLVVEDHLVVAEALAARTASCQALLIADYCKGVCTPELLAPLLALAAPHPVPVLVDRAHIADYARYRGAEVIKPMVIPVLGGILIADEVIDLFLPVLFHAVRHWRWQRRQCLFGTKVMAQDLGVQYFGRRPKTPGPVFG